MERVINFNTLNNSEINKHYKLIETSDKLLEKMKESGEKFFNKEYKYDIKEESLLSSGAITQGVWMNLDNEEFVMTEKEIVYSLIQRLEKAYKLNRIEEVCDKGYLVTVEDNGELFYVLSTYCKENKYNNI